MALNTIRVGLVQRAKEWNGDDTKELNDIIDGLEAVLRDIQTTDKDEAEKKKLEFLTVTNTLLDREELPVHERLVLTMWLGATQGIAQKCQAQLLEHLFELRRTVSQQKTSDRAAGETLTDMRGVALQLHKIIYKMSENLTLEDVKEVTPENEEAWAKRVRGHLESKEEEEDPKTAVGNNANAEEA